MGLNGHMPQVGTFFIKQVKAAGGCLDLGVGKRYNSCSATELSEQRFAFHYSVGNAQYHMNLTGSRSCLIPSFHNI